MPQTETIKINPTNPEADKIAHSAKIIRNGGLVIFPTETVYGIAANFLDKKAVERLYELKNRPQDKQFSIHIADKEKVEEYAVDISVLAYKFMDKFWPGPLTIILKSKDGDTVGLRMPKNNIALSLISEAEVPIVAPSANISGKSAPKTFTEALKDLNGLVDLAIDGGNTEIGIESTVVDLTVTPPKILRPGAIKEEEIEKLSKTKTILFVCTGNSCRSVMARYLLEKALKQEKRDDVEVLSAGISAFSGMGATRETIELLKREGIDVPHHKPENLSDEIIKKSDLILVMNKTHEEAVIKRVTHTKNRVYLLKEFAKIEGQDLDINDPIGRSEEFYREVFATIKEAIERIVKLI